MDSANLTGNLSLEAQCVELYQPSNLRKDRYFAQVFGPDPVVANNARFLFERVGLLGEKYFGDMSFSKDWSSSPDYQRLIYRTTDIYPSLEYGFPYEAFQYQIEPLPGITVGRFDPLDYSMTVDPEFKDHDTVLLHEMIHMHEQVINAAPLTYHDALLLYLYKDLKGKIPDLDNLISLHMDFDGQRALSEDGGEHDLLFFLKSYDLDLRTGHPLGTVFGYDYEKVRNQ